MRASVKDRTAALQPGQQSKTPSEKKNNNNNNNKKQKTWFPAAKMKWLKKLPLAENKEGGEVDVSHKSHKARLNVETWKNTVSEAKLTRSKS